MYPPRARARARRMDGSDSFESIGPPAVLVQGPALADLAYLTGLGIRYRSRTDGVAPSPSHRRLLSALNAAAEATLAAADVRNTGHVDVREAAGPAQLAVGTGTEGAARLLEVTPRHVRRLAEELGGHRVGRTWRFDRAAILAAAARRQERM